MMNTLLVLGICAGVLILLGLDLYRSRRAAPEPVSSSPFVVLSIARDALYLAAVRLVTAAELTPDVSGEWKRHQVYAALIKAFPDRSKPDLALAIEAAVRIR